MGKRIAVGIAAGLLYVWTVTPFVFANTMYSSALDNYMLPIIITHHLALAGFIFGSAYAAGRIFNWERF